MQPTAPVRLAFYGLFATFLVGGAATASTPGPSATAANDPCAASEIARIIGSVATNTGNYLDTHPPTNTALTAASQQQGRRLRDDEDILRCQPRRARTCRRSSSHDGTRRQVHRCRITFPSCCRWCRAHSKRRAPGVPVNPPSPQTATGPRPGRCHSAGRADRTVAAVIKAIGGLWWIGLMQGKKVQTNSA
jgi:hypothetical protein